MCKRDPKCLELISNPRKTDNEKKDNAYLIPSGKNMDQRTHFCNSATEINNFAANKMEEGQIFNVVIPAKSFNQISIDLEEKNNNGDGDYISLVALYQRANKLIHNTGFRFKF